MRPESPPAIDKLRVCSLFSGVGGFELGLSKAGHSTVLMCESDPHAQAVLRARFPEIELVSDVTKMAELPVCDLLTGGWPCQDLSLAGETKGLSGSRSSLVSEIFRLIASSPHKPRYVLLENVAFALDLQKGRAVSFVVEQLEALGYSWAYRILDTQSFGLPQRRRRLYVLASLNDDAADILLDGINGPAPDQASNLETIGFYWTEGTRGLGWSPGAIPPLKGGSGLGIPSPPAVWDRATATFKAPGIEDAERLQGFPAGWTSPSSFLARGDRRRWVLAGNAVSIPVVEWIGRRLGSRRLDQNPPFEIVVDANRTNLPRAAFGGPRTPIVSVVSRREGPSICASVSLKDFGLTMPSLMSSRAISGFTRRYESGSLRKNPEFLAALKSWIEKCRVI